MDGNFNLLTVLAAVVAVVAILKLRSVLGRRSGDEEERINQRARAQREAEQARERAMSSKVVSIPRRERPEEPAPARQTAAVAVADVEARFLAAANGDAGLQQDLLRLYRADSSFEPDGFMRGAKSAYEMIVTAFGEGNRKVLKELLSREVFDGFAAAITEREQRGEQIDQSFVGILKSDIVEAELKGGVAQVTVKFVSQLISATRDRGGQIISGDPQRITDVTDIWTFAREVSARNPNWRLIATQASN